MAVDVGNAQTVLGRFEGVELRGQWRISTETRRISGEPTVVFALLLDLNGLEPGRAHRQAAGR